MSQKLFFRLRVISIAIFLIGVVSVGLAYSLHRRNGPRLRHGKGFTIITKETIGMSDPNMQSQPDQADYVIKERYQKSDGTWKEVITEYKNNGQEIKKDSSFGIPGRGVFKIDKDQGVLNFLSSMPPKEVTALVPITDGHDKQRFLKDEVVQGYKTYVLHYVEKDGSYQDEYYALDLDGYPIKSVIVTPRGTSVTEAIQITLGDPDEKVFGSLPNWLVKYDRFREKIQALEEDGKHETAGAMRRELEQQLAKQVKDQ